MKTERREFLKYGLATSSLFLGSLYGIESFKKLRKERRYQGQWVDNSGRGHQLRIAVNQPVAHFSKEPVLIVGGGMSGLVTGYYLKKNGFTDFKIIEINSEAGGNSSYGENSTSKYPWGAHYIPLPNKENRDLGEFFKALGVAKSGATGLEYNEEYLCQDPQERLLIKGEWQESLLPTKNISEKDKKELERFQDLVDDFKLKKGRDDKFCFTIPVMESSQDPEFLKLDSISFRAFLTEKGFQSDVLNWYVNYCTLDDFGMGAPSVSAWAGLHYFCSRRPTHEYDDHKILTWPEGNGWILRKLVDELKDHIEINQAALKIESKGGKIESQIYNFETKEVTQYESNKLVFSAPQFLSPHIFVQEKKLDQVTADDYYSWLVANITVKLTREQLRTVHWDNVRFQSESLGYVNARHQELRSRVDDQTVLTLYWPLYDKDLTATEVRKKIATWKWNEWAPKVESELESMHPGIAPFIQAMDIKIHGHAMIGPRIGRMAKVFDQHKSEQIDKNIFFAHTDNSGMSLFEEAHYWGLKTAKGLLSSV